MHYSEDEILKGITQGNSAVLQFLYKEYFNQIAYHIYKNKGSEQDAKDVFQDAILLLYDKLKSGSLALSCKTGTYLNAVCRKMWLKKLAYQGKFSGTLFEEQEDHATIEDDCEDFIKQERELQRMKQSLLQLGEPCQTLLTDYYYLHLSMEDISSKFGYTNSDNAKNQKYKCLQRLKRYFFNTKQ